MPRQVALDMIYYDQDKRKRGDEDGRKEKKRRTNGARG